VMDAEHRYRACMSRAQALYDITQPWRR
jgi:hypothetical protein